MIRPFVLLLALVAPVLPIDAAAQQPGSPAPIVFFDIAGPDGTLRQFYADLFAWLVAPDGSFTVTAAAPLPALIRRDPAETVVYVGVDDIAATLRRAETLGGTIESQRFEVPGRVVLGLLKDPAGNRVGLVELENGKPKIPIPAPESEKR